MRTAWAQRRRDPRGTILVVSVLLLTLLTTLGVGLLSSSMNESIISSNEANAQRALALAEAGISHARRVISANLSTTSLTSRLSGATSSAPGVALSGFTNVEPFGSGNGTYSVWVSNDLARDASNLDLTCPSTASGVCYNRKFSYATEGTPAADGDNLIWVKSVGTYKNATRAVRVLLDFSKFSDPPGAITLVDGNTQNTTTFSGNSFLITGNDTALPSVTSGTATGSCTTTPSGSKSGIAVNSSGSLGELTTGSGALNSGTGGQYDNVCGTGNTGCGTSNAAITNVDGTTDEISSGALLTMANTLATTPGATTLAGGNHTNATFGSPTDNPPKVFVASSNVTFLGQTKGYGVLIVNATAGGANLTFAGNSVWEGLVIVVGNGNVTLAGTGSSGDEGKIFGALLVANTQGGTTVMTAAGNGGVKYSSQALCRVTNMVPTSVVIAWQQVS